MNLPSIITIDDLVSDYFNDYHRMRNYIINEYSKFRSFEDLKSLPKDKIKDFVSKFTTVRSISLSNKFEGAIKLGENNNWEVYKITKYPAAVFYGKNTKWCISGNYDGEEHKGQDYFDKYIVEKNLDDGYYIFINKNNNKDKYCLLQDKTGEIKSLWNAADKDIYNFNDENCINLLKSFPKIKEIKLLKHLDDNLLYYKFIDAIKDGMIDDVENCISQGVDVNRKTNNNCTPLYFACQEDFYDIAELLISNGANETINIQDDDGVTPLLNACEADDADLVLLLLNNGAKSSMLVNDFTGNTPLESVCSSGNLELVKTFMENVGKQYINFKNSDGDTPLYFAFRKGEIDVIEYLLANGAEKYINNKLNDGNTLLHVFTELNEPDIILLLLDYDANPFIKNNDNKLPIDLIAHNDRDSLIIKNALENAMN